MHYIINIQHTNDKSISVTYYKYVYQPSLNMYPFPL